MRLNKITWSRSVAKKWEDWALETATFSSREMEGVSNRHWEGPAVRGRRSRRPKWPSGKQFQGLPNRSRAEARPLDLTFAGWHHWLDGRGPGWTPAVGDGQGGLACCDSWSREDMDMTEQLNWTELNDNFLKSFPNCVADSIWLVANSRMVTFYGCQLCP